MNHFKLLVSLVALLIVGTLQAQKTVKGKVTDPADNNSPLPGVIVVEEGTNNNTVTNIDGDFTITVKDANSVLVFTLVGSEPQKVKADKDVLDVKLKTGTQLKEVVVTALGITREKKALGYSVQEVKSDALNQAGQSNAVGALSGKVAGAIISSSSGTPGGGMKIQLRAATTISGSNSPLIIIDGMPVDNSSIYSGDQVGSVSPSNRLSDINPEDIENITVLKGPSAASLYGSRASNGALVITTKKGAKNGKKFTVTYSTNLTFDQANKFIERQDVYAQGNGGNFSAPSFNTATGGVTSGTSLSWGPKLSDLVYDGNTAYLWNPNGKLVLKSANPNGKEAIKYDPYDFFQTGVTMGHNIAISGGNNDLVYRISLGRNNQTGIMPGTDYKRNTANISTSYKFTDKLKVSTDLNFSNAGGVKPQQGSNVSGVMLGLVRSPINFDNSNGVTDYTDKSAYVLNDGSERQRTYRGIGGYDNPYWTVNKNKYSDNVNRAFGNIAVNYSPIANLSVTNRFGVDAYNDTRQQLYEVGAAAHTLGQIVETSINNSIINNDIFASYYKDLNESIRLSVLLGNNLYAAKQSISNQIGDNLTFPNYPNMQNANVFHNSSTYANVHQVSNYGQLRVDYKNYLYLEGNIRYEKNSKLKSSYTYPGVNAGFIFSDALKLNSSIFNYGKVRASVVGSGQASLPAYSWTTQYYTGKTILDGWTNGITMPGTNTNTGGPLSGYAINNTIGNPDLKAERTNTFEVGTELRFFNNRLYIDYTYFNSHSKDLLLAVNISSASGYSYKMQNAAAMQSHGHEVMMNIVALKNEEHNFNWTINTNFATYRSKVTALAPGVENVFIYGNTGAEIDVISGQPFGVIYGTNWARDNEGRLIIDSDKNSATYGQPYISPSNKVLGNPNPKWTGSIGSSLTFKDFSFGFLFETRQKYQIMNVTKGVMNYFGTGKETQGRESDVKVFDGVKGTKDFLGNIVSTGEQNDIQIKLDQSYYQGNASGFSVIEPYIEDASWVRLREITFGYKITKKILGEKSFINAINVSLIGRNLFLWTKFTGVDPEVSVGGSGNPDGYHYFNNPNTRSYGFSLRAEF